MLSASVRLLFSVLGTICVVTAIPVGACARDLFGDPLPVRQVSIGKVDGHDIYTTGTFDDLAVSPDWQSDLILQKGNEGLRRKIVPRQSSAIEHNYIGVGSRELPFIESGDFLPWRPVHLIDRDTESGWRGRGWVQIDLPHETSISGVAVWPLPGTRLALAGDSFRLRVETSTDLVTWEPTADAQLAARPENDGPTADISFAARPARQVRLILETNALWEIAEVDVYDPDGRNIGLASISGESL